MTISPQKNVLVDDAGGAVLCDATLNSMMFGEDDCSTISSKWWWMPHEQLIVDDDADDECAVAPPSMPADMYGAALTIAQVALLFFMVVACILIPDTRTFCRCGRCGAHSTTCATSTSSL
jgi:hypothetical protein